MTRDEIMQGLNACIADVPDKCWENGDYPACPYNNHVDGCQLLMMKDVAELLKAETPRLLTLKEAQTLKTPGTLVWLETSGGYDGSRYKAIPAIVSDNTHGILPDGAMHFYNTTDRAWSAYNREICGWRLWSSEPSDQRRLEAKWADDTVRQDTAIP